MLHLFEGIGALIVFNLLVDIIQLECKIINVPRAVHAMLSCLIKPINGQVHRVSFIYLEQVSVDLVHSLMTQAGYKLRIVGQSTHIELLP